MGSSPMPVRDDHHGHSLAEDLKAMEALDARRRALKWFAGASMAGIVAACGEGSGSSSTTGTTATTTPTPTPTATATATGSCIVDPTETGGPYPADGTNTSSGSTSN